MRLLAVLAIVAIIAVYLNTHQEPEEPPEVIYQESIDKAEALEQQLQEFEKQRGEAIERAGG